VKSDGVDVWLKHWLKLQKKNKHPLVLKDPLDKPSDHHAPQIVSRGRGRRRPRLRILTATISMMRKWTIM